MHLYQLCFNKARRVNVLWFDCGRYKIHSTYEFWKEYKYMSNIKRQWHVYPHSVCLCNTLSVTSTVLPKLSYSAMKYTVKWKIKGTVSISAQLRQLSNNICDVLLLGFSVESFITQQTIIMKYISCPSVKPFTLTWTVWGQWPAVLQQCVQKSDLWRIVSP